MALSGLLAIIAVIDCAFQIIPPELTNYSFQDDLRNIAMVGGANPHQTDQERMDAILKKAQEHQIALVPEQITVQRIQTPGAPAATLVATAGEPIDAAVQPSTGGNLVYAVDLPDSIGNAAVEGFTLELSTGALSPIAGISATGSQGEFDQTGKYRFVVSSSHGTPSALDAFDVSAIALTTHLATVGWTPGGLVAFRPALGCEC